MEIKLYVDDIRQAPEGWVLVETVTEAIRLIDTMTVTEISVDHDISIPVRVGKISRPFPSPETFEPVLRFVRARALAGLSEIKKITLHTSNTGKAKVMAAFFDKVPGVRVKINLSKPCNKWEDES